MTTTPTSKMPKTDIDFVVKDLEDEVRQQIKRESTPEGADMNRSEETKDRMNRTRRELDARIAKEHQEMQAMFKAQHEAEQSLIMRHSEEEKAMTDKLDRLRSEMTKAVEDLNMVRHSHVEDLNALRHRHKLEALDQSRLHASFVRARQELNGNGNHSDTSEEVSKPIVGLGRIAQRTEYAQRTDYAKQPDADQAGSHGDTETSTDGDPNA